MNETQLAFQNFSIVSGLAVTIIDTKGQALFESEGYAGAAAFVRMMEDAYGLAGQCTYAKLYAGYQSVCFDGRYIFYDPMGLVYFVAPLMEQGVHVSSVISGPLIMTERAEYFEIDVQDRFHPDAAFSRQLRAALSAVPVVIPKRVYAMAEQQFVCAAFCSGGLPLVHQKQEMQRMQSYLHTYISDAKDDMANRLYPIKKEEELLSSISRGDVFLARALLNEILGHIFFHSGQDLEVIRSRVIELIVLLSRAAVKGGASAETIFAMNYDYFQEIEGMHTVEDLTYWLSQVMNKFTGTIFSFANAKHADVLYRAVMYIKTNYMKKLTLEDVAGHVFLSPAYLSKIFKDETGCNFNTYLNTIRIEESKRLLPDNSIELVDISSMVGYEDQSYFSKVFKKLVGLSPGKFRQANYK